MGRGEKIRESVIRTDVSDKQGSGNTVCLFLPVRIKNRTADVWHEITGVSVHIGCCGLGRRKVNSGV